MRRSDGFRFVGSCSEGTLRTEDLLPAFMSLLDDVKEDASLNSPPTINPELFGKIDTLLGEIERRQEADGYFESEEAEYDLDEVREYLESFAPEGLYFGSGEGDGASFGYWPSDDFLSNPEDHGFVKLNDVPDFPLEETDGETPDGCIVVSDHGNVSVYSADGRLLWDCV